MLDRRDQTLPAAIEVLEPLILMSASSIEGTDAGDWISGSSLDDVIDAGAGNDEIHSSMGHNLIDGGRGTDTLVVYEGVRADFQLQRLADGRVLVEGPGLNGVPVVNELQNVERIAFNDELILTENLVPIDQADETPDLESAVRETAWDGTEEEPGLTESNEEASSKSGSAKSGSAKSGSAKSGSAKSGSAKSGSAKSGSAKSASDKSGSDKSASDKSGSAKSGSAKSGSAKSGSAKSGSAKSGSAKSASDKSKQTAKSAESEVAEADSLSVAANLAPIARQDYYVADQSSLIGNVLINDVDPEGDQLQVSLASQPQHGSVVLNRDGDFSYIPQQGFAGTDSFRYQLSDGRGGLMTGEVTIDVQASERLPSVGPDVESDLFHFDVGAVLFGNVSSNDAGVVGTGELRYDLIEDVSAGQLNFYADGSFDYVASEQGVPATFRYRVTDVTGTQATANVRLNPSGQLTPNPEPPELPQPPEPPQLPESFTALAPAASAERAFADEASPAPPAGPPAAPASPPPVPEAAAVPVDRQPDADADIVAAAAGQPLVISVLQNDVDADGDDLFLVDHTQAEHGSVALNADGTLTYTAAVGFTGIDFLHYTVSDGDQTDQATVVVHVNAAGQLPENVGETIAAEMVVSPIVFDLNDDGQIGVTGETTARDKSAITSVGRTVEFDLDADGQAESIEWIDGRGDAFLVDSSQIRGTDIDGRALFGDEGGRYANGFEKLEAFDRDGNGLVEMEEFGRLRLWVDNGDGVLQPGELETLQRHDVFAIDTRMELTPDGLMQSVAFVGNDAEMLIEDVWFAEQDADPATSAVSENPDNLDPDANPDSISVAANSDVVAQVLTNDRDADGGTLRVVSHTRAIHGEVVVTDDGQLRYTPDPDFVGNDYVQYTVSDGQGGTDTAIVLLQVRSPATAGGSGAQDTAGTPSSDTVGVVEGTVWLDVNQNGLREDSEQGRGEGVFVSLLNAEGIVTQSVHTDSQGAYQFDDLAAGRYSIRIDQTTLPSFADQQARFSAQDVNSNFLNAVDSDIDSQSGESSVVLLGDARQTVRIDAGYYFA